MFWICKIVILGLLINSKIYQQLSNNSTSDSRDYAPERVAKASHTIISIIRALPWASKLCLSCCLTLLPLCLLVPVPWRFAPCGGDRRSGTVPRTSMEAFGNFWDHRCRLGSRRSRVKIRFLCGVGVKTENDALFLGGLGCEKSTMKTYNVHVVSTCRFVQSTMAGALVCDAHRHQPKCSLSCFLSESSKVAWNGYLLLVGIVCVCVLIYWDYSFLPALTQQSKCHC